MNRNRRIQLLVIAIALVVLLSACGGGSSGMYEEPIGAEGGWGWLQWIITLVADFTYWVSLQLGGNFWIGLIVVTLIVRSAGWPIYAKSNAMTTNMQQAQPELNKIQEKYKGRKDEVSQKKQQQETVEVYRKYGINPLGCLLPFLQMPIFLAMYQVVRRLPKSAGMTSDGVVSDTIRNYQDLNYNFLGLDLKAGVDFSVFASDGIWAGLGTIFPDILLAVMVGILMFAYQKYAQSKPDYLQNKKFQSAQAQQTANQMKYFSYVMVFMLVSIAVTNNGIALYWVVGNSFQFLQTYINRQQTKKKYEANKSGSLVL